MISTLFTTGFMIEPYIEYSQKEIVFDIASDVEGYYAPSIGGSRFSDISGMGGGFRFSRVVVMQDRLAWFFDGDYGSSEADEGKASGDFARGDLSGAEETRFSFDTGFKVALDEDMKHQVQASFGMHHADETLQGYPVEFDDQGNGTLGTTEMDAYTGERRGFAFAIGSAHQLLTWSANLEYRLGWDRYEGGFQGSTDAEGLRQGGYQHRGDSTSQRFSIEMRRKVFHGAWFVIGYRKQIDLVEDGYHSWDQGVTRLNELEMTRDGFTAGISMSF